MISEEHRSNIQSTDGQEQTHVTLSSQWIRACTKKKFKTKEPFWCKTTMNLSLSTLRNLEGTMCSITIHPSFLFLLLSLIHFPFSMSFGKHNAALFHYTEEYKDNIQISWVQFHSYTANSRAFQIYFIDGEAKSHKYIQPDLLINYLSLLRKVFTLVILKRKL